MKKNIKITVLLIITLVFIAGCKAEKQDVNSDIEAENTKKTLKIARQFGLAYAPLTIMEDQKLIEKHAPSLGVEWVQLGNTAAIREAILSDQLDIGFMGIPPYLIGAENGMNWQIFTGLSQAPLGLMSNDEQINELSDIRQDQKIALPQPGSIQHILLSMAAKRELGNAKVFDNQLVSMKHPDGVQLLLSDSDISMHFTSPPYIFEEQEAGMNQVISGEEAFGGQFTFIVGTLREEMLGEITTVQAVKNALDESIAFMENNKEETLNILSKQYGIDSNKLEKFIYEENMSYSRDVLGLESFVGFMIDEMYISDSIQDKQLIWSE